METTTTTTTMLQQQLQHVPPAELNNGAVALIQRGRTDDAMELLQMALAKLRNQFHNDSATASTGPQQQIASGTTRMGGCPQQGEESTISTNAAVTFSCGSTINVFGSCCPIWTTSQQDAGVVDGYSFLEMYDRGLLVDTTGTSSSNQQHGGGEEEDGMLLSSVILFNMALLHHAKGLQNQGDSSSNGTLSSTSVCLDRARRLYRIAIDVLTKRRGDGVTSHHRPPNNTSGGDLLLYLALFNNLAHIDSYLFRVEDMKDSLEQMRIILSRTTDNLPQDSFEDAGDGDNEIPIEEEDYMVFSLNAMFGTAEKFSVAPAA